jgi:hypothetical protein
LKAFRAGVACPGTRTAPERIRGTCDSTPNTPRSREPPEIREACVRTGRGSHGPCERLRRPPGCSPFSGLRAERIRRKGRGARQTRARNRQDYGAGRPSFRRTGFCASAFKMDRGGNLGHRQCCDSVCRIDRGEPARKCDFSAPLGNAARASPEYAAKFGFSHFFMFKRAP